MAETEPIYTNRGFRVYAEISDSNRSEVRVQESSTANEARVWIFCENADMSYVRQAVAPTPHLNVTQARVVRDALTEFIDEQDRAESAS